ncbi:hypothetical protein BDK51DRAFT_28055 [Blyttiomyces helicus]|uniref:DH domain-containing protein n=1 Tax=Blyttiomyces helicus TaxID=388810 RepID=A0A4P9WEG4_9FUNG|nr:hypothetical protein BDK51DRAFT_28055 [Blyttiomyces helicus]|eukprot:RKO89658.1 hypothetical protein BDK51DRAFT_28055 [Blyttiomyces helicus]
MSNFRLPHYHTKLSVPRHGKKRGAILATPIQRVPRYPILLAAVIERIPKTDSNHDRLIHIKQRAELLCHNFDASGFKARKLAMQFELSRRLGINGQSVSDSLCLLAELRVQTSQGTDATLLLYNTMIFQVNTFKNNKKTASWSTDVFHIASVFSVTKTTDQEFIVLVSTQADIEAGKSLEAVRKVLAFKANSTLEINTFVRMLRHVLVCRNHAPQALNGSAAGLYAQRIGQLDIYFRFVEPGHVSPSTVANYCRDRGGVPTNVQKAQIALVQCDEEFYLRETVEQHSGKYPVIGAIGTNADENPVAYDQFRLAMVTSLNAEKCGYVPLNLHDVESTKKRMEYMFKNALTIIAMDPEASIPEFRHRIEGLLEHIWAVHSTTCTTPDKRSLCKSTRNPGAGGTIRRRRNAHVGASACAEIVSRPCQSPDVEKPPLLGSVPDRTGGQVDSQKPSAPLFSSEVSSSSLPLAAAKEEVTPANGGRLKRSSSIQMLFRIHDGNIDVYSQVKDGAHQPEVEAYLVRLREFPNDALNEAEGMDVVFLIAVVRKYIADEHAIADSEVSSKLHKIKDPKTAPGSAKVVKALKKLPKPTSQSLIITLKHLRGVCHRTATAMTRQKAEEILTRFLASLIWSEDEIQRDVIEVASVVLFSTSDDLQEATESIATARRPPMPTIGTIRRRPRLPGYSPSVSSSTRTGRVAQSPLEDFSPHEVPIPEAAEIPDFTRIPPVIRNRRVSDLLRQARVSFNVARQERDALVGRFQELTIKCSPFMTAKAAEGATAWMGPAALPTSDPGEQNADAAVRDLLKNTRDTLGGKDCVALVDLKQAVDELRRENELWRKVRSDSSIRSLAGRCMAMSDSVTAAHMESGANILNHFTFAEKRGAGREAGDDGQGGGSEISAGFWLGGGLGSLSGANNVQQSCLLVQPPVDLSRVIVTSSFDTSPSENSITFSAVCSKSASTLA